MRLHRVLIIGLRQALSEALFSDKYADKVIEKTLKANKKWGSKDRAFVAQSFYDIIIKYYHRNIITTIQYNKKENVLK